MSIGACRECGSEVSSEAKLCPYCAAEHPVPTMVSFFSQIVSLIFGAFGLAILLLFLYLIYKVL